MRRLSLQEYRTESGIALRPDEALALRRLVPMMSISPSALGSGRYDLNPGSSVGSILLGDLAIELRPKIEISRVLFLLSYSLRSGDWNERNLFEHASARSLVEAIVPAFVAQVRRALSRGILQGYRTEDAALLTVRGRLRFDDQIRDRFGVFPPIEVRYDEFTEDVTVNRLIKAALARLERLVPRSAETLPKLRALHGSLERVQLVEYAPTALPEVQYDRLNEHYRPAVELAKLILRSTSFDLGHGSVAASCFLLDMARIFEDFVVIALREALALSDTNFPQNARGKILRLDRSGKVVLEPDLSWWESGRCTFVGDVKYKRVDVRGIKHPDLYQLLAYTVAIDVPEGVLIYGEGKEEPVCHEIEPGGKRIHVSSLDLSAEPDEILERLRRLAGVIRGVRERNKERLTAVTK